MSAKNAKLHWIVAKHWFVLSERFGVFCFFGRLLVFVWVVFEFSVGLCLVSWLV